MNITEASDTNTVLRALLHRPSPGSAFDTDRVRDAAVRLTERAYKALSAGLVPEQTNLMWTDVTSRLSAVSNFLATFDSYVVADLGPKLTCRESDALVTLLATHGQPTEAAALWHAHAEHDEPGDQHYTAPSAFQVIGTISVEGGE